MKSTLISFFLALFIIASLFAITKGFRTSESNTGEVRAPAPANIEENGLHPSDELQKEGIARQAEGRWTVVNHDLEGSLRLVKGELRLTLTNRSDKPMVVREKREPMTIGRSSFGWQAIGPTGLIMPNSFKGAEAGDRWFFRNDKIYSRLGRSINDLRSYEKLAPGESYIAATIEPGEDLLKVFEGSLPRETRVRVMVRPQSLRMGHPLDPRIYPHLIAAAVKRGEMDQERITEAIKKDTPFLNSEAVRSWKDAGMIKTDWIPIVAIPGAM